MSSPAETRESTDARQLYLQLLKRAVTGSTHHDFYSLQWPYLGPRWKLRPMAAEVVRRLARARGIETVYRASEDQVREGHVWPLVGETMIGLKRLDNLQACIERVLSDDIPGDLIETGVWRGGAAIFMRGVLKAYDVTDRCVYAADSFEGLPSPDADQYPEDHGDRYYTLDQLAVGLEVVRDNFERYGLLDDQVRFLKGWFRDTLPTVSDIPWAVLRLDGDMYESTMDAFTNLYPQLSPGGFLIIDDYYLDGCRQAVHDYREQHGITEPIQRIDEKGAYWRRES